MFFIDIMFYLFRQGYIQLNQVSYRFYFKNNWEDI